MSNVAEKFPEGSFHADEYDEKTPKKDTPHLRLIKNEEPELVHPVSEDAVLFTGENISEVPKDNINAGIERQERTRIEELKKKLYISPEDLKDWSERVKNPQNTKEKSDMRVAIHQRIDEYVKTGDLSEINVNDAETIAIIIMEIRMAERKLEEEKTGMKMWGRLKRRLGIKTEAELRVEKLIELGRYTALTSKNAESAQQAIDSSQQRNQQSGSGSTNYYERKQ